MPTMIPTHAKRYIKTSAVAVAAVVLGVCSRAATESAKVLPEAAFTRVQTDLFTQPMPVTVAFGDYDNDGWIDMLVGYAAGPVRLFHNDHGRFVDVTAEVGLTAEGSVRAVAFGDFDKDGFLDIYIGFDGSAKRPNLLLHNDGHGHFHDQAQERGVQDTGDTRQVSFIDYDNDGQMDLLVCFRNQSNRLYHNEGGHFRDVAAELGITGKQNTVGAIWLDYNEDGRLDLFLANQSGMLNRVYRNDGARFTNVAGELGLDGAGRTSAMGSVGIAVADYDGDGALDLFYANYGPSWLMRNDGKHAFVNVAAQLGVAIDAHLVAAGWGDYDNDGRPDLYTDGYLAGHRNVRDYLMHNEGDHFSDTTPQYILDHDADHGVYWIDYDRDGAVDLVLCDHEHGGVLSVYHNNLPQDNSHLSLEVLVLDAQGRYTRAGSEVRIFAAGTRRVLGARLVDSGSGYNSQSAAPVHFGLGREQWVDIEVTSMSGQGRKVTRVEHVDARARRSIPLEIRTHD